MHPGKNIPTVGVLYCGQVNLFWKAKFLFHFKDLLGKIDGSVQFCPWDGELTFDTYSFWENFGVTTHKSDMDLVVGGYGPKIDDVAPC